MTGPLEYGLRMKNNEDFEIFCTAHGTLEDIEKKTQDALKKSESFARFLFGSIMLFLLFTGIWIFFPHSQTKKAGNENDSK